MLIIYTDSQEELHLKKWTSKFSHDKTHNIKALELLILCVSYDFSDLSQSILIISLQILLRLHLQSFLLRYLHSGHR